jgi:hypothetical protein
LASTASVGPVVTYVANVYGTAVKNLTMIGCTGEVSVISDASGREYAGVNIDNSGGLTMVALLASNKFWRSGVGVGTSPAGIRLVGDAATVGNSAAKGNDFQGPWAYGVRTVNTDKCVVTGNVSYDSVTALSSSSGDTNRFSNYNQSWNGAAWINV